MLHQHMYRAKHQPFRHLSLLIAMDQDLQKGDRIAVRERMLIVQLTAFSSLHACLLPVGDCMQSPTGSRQACSELNDGHEVEEL